jgi:hypothetical protein
MAGIEQAFKDFVKRVSEKENQEQVSGERGFQYGGGAIGYADGGRINYAGGGSGLPPVEEDQSEQLFGQNIQTPPTGFNFAVNRPMPVYQEGQPEISGGIRDLRNYVNSTMGNINPQLNYTDNNFGGNVSAMMNPFTNMPKSYSADAYYGPEQGRFNLGFTTVPTADARQIRAGYEGPYGNISLGASRDPSGNNYMLNYSNSFADGGDVISKVRAGDPNSAPLMNNLASGLAIQLDRPVQPGDPVGSFYTPTNINLLSPVAPTGKVLKPEYQNGIPIGLVMPQDFYYMDAPITPTQNTTSNLPSDLSIDQIQSLSPRDRIIRALKLAGFSSSDVDSILAKQGFANGGKVNTDLTRTIPPDSGPDPQGVETLFKRRYN